MSDELFESPRFLLDGAREDIEEFAAAEAAFANDPEVCAKVVEMDPHTGDKLIKLRIVKQPSKALRRLAHHVVGDLRHALDQAVFAACKRVTGIAPKDVYFPFASHPNDLRHKLKRLPSALHPLFEREQPYPTGDGYDGGDNVLRLLGTLAGPNKHEIALSVGPNVNTLKIIKVSGYNFATPFPELDRAKNEVTIFRIFPGGDVEYELFLPIHITLSEGKGQGSPLLPLLAAWLDRVKAIIDALEGEAAPESP